MNSTHSPEDNKKVESDSDPLTQESISLPNTIDDSEFLYRGIVRNNWDIINNRITSAAFKDSGGASVDRDGGRPENECVTKHRGNERFVAICKIKTEAVKKSGALVLYKPIDSNIYHSEIHDSNVKPQLTGSKLRKLKESSILVYKHPDI